MAAPCSPISEEYHSVSEGEDVDEAGDDTDSGAMEPPVHPVTAMQAAFEESIVESTMEFGRTSPERDAEARRQKLLNSPQYDHSLNSRWNQRKTAQHHPLMKLLAQIVFGMHLLQQEQAKSEEEVVKILQKHVNEVDAFLERTSEDFELAIKDIEERIKFLKLPMKHLDVFNIMLEEKKFRKSLLEGNEKIEKIIERTTQAKKAALLDMKIGVDAVKELRQYLDGVSDQWPREKRAISDVFGAMRGNEQGWSGYLEDLQGKGRTLELNMANLAGTIAQMSKLAAAASRRSRTQNDRQASQPYVSPLGSTSAPSSPGLRSKFAPDANPPPMPTSALTRTASLNKPLPQAPQADAGAAQENRPSTGRHIPLAQRYESPRQMPHHHNPRRVTASAAGGEPPRPKTADGPVRRKEARAADQRTNTAELLSFFKAEHQNPLRSNPPGEQQQQLTSSSPERRPIRTNSEGANLMLNTRAPNQVTSNGRSLSQGAIGMQNTAPKSVPLVLPSIIESEKPATYQPEGAQSPPQRSAFARRWSKRMRHMQDPAQSPPQSTQPSMQRSAQSSPNSEKTLSHPMDSAYASSIEKTAPQPEPVGFVSEGGRQPAKGFTLFPQAPARTPSVTMPLPRHDSMDDHKSIATSMSKGRSFGSMRKFLHLRKSSKMWS